VGDLDITSALICSRDPSLVTLELKIPTKP